MLHHSPVANLTEHGQPVIIHKGRQPVAQLEYEDPQGPPVGGPVMSLVHYNLGGGMAAGRDGKLVNVEKR